MGLGSNLGSLIEPPTPDGVSRMSPGPPELGKRVSEIEGLGLGVIGFRVLGFKV